MIKKRKMIIIVAVVISLILFAIYLAWPRASESGPSTVEKASGIIELPAPKTEGKMSVEGAIQKRRSIRKYTDEPITLEDISQLLWAAQGITDPEKGYRAAPSAGRTYPLEIYLVVGKGGVKGLLEGVYHYDPSAHALKKILEGDIRSDLAKAAHGQPWVAEAPVNIVITADYNRTTNKYGDLGARFVHMEVGHAGENIYLEATARGLATVSLGSFYEDQVKELLKIPDNENVLYIFPVGHSAS